MKSPTRTTTPTEPLADIVARLARAQKSNRGAAAYSRWVNRPVGRYIAALAYRQGLTPNQVTLISAVLTFSGLAVIALVRPTPAVGVLIALLLMAGYAFDAADGQLARLRGGGSAAGEWLDHVVDGTKIAIIHLAVLISWYRWYDLPDERLLLVPMLFAVQASVFFFALILTEQLRRSAAGTTPSSRPASSEPAPYLRSLVVLPGDYGLLCVVFALIGFSRVFVVLYGALAVINTLFLLAGAVRWYREMRTLS
ncbi:CDP-alcohol phosphatidyltransferase family protein [Cellulomonas aerilata]|uniref:CDP-alcohol phosphatidyltransferase n=1 Tax=Cellulomonas aerilata TaxID=515326 RepID=A0A512DDT6_9CELL|nr:CDP-alcohol phosphatidyltransferase family protein [Cellulomonas aerilata]GEO34636.1 CDP-alcohol phosphatidyltransferase [Cellulomonas aerilata]